MAPRKPVKRLTELATNIVVKSLREAFGKLEDYHNDIDQIKFSNKLISLMHGDQDEDKSWDKISQIKSYFQGLSVTIQDNLAMIMFNIMEEEYIDKYTNVFLTDERSESLHLSLTNEDHIDQIVKNCLLKADNVKQLTLGGVDSEFLELVGKNCRKLTMLSLPGFYACNDDIHWITPTTEDNELCINNGCGVNTHGCQGLVSLDIEDYEEGPEMEQKFLKFFRHLKTFSYNGLEYNVVTVVENLTLFTSHRTKGVDMKTLNSVDDMVMIPLSSFNQKTNDNYINIY